MNTSRLDRFIPALICIASFLLYIITLDPSIRTMFDDSLEFQYGLYTGAILHPTGYPLYSILGWLWVHLVPVGEVAYRANLLGKVKDVTALLSASRARVRRFAANNSALKTQIDQYQQTITSLQAMVDRQKQDILVLTGRVDSLTTANTQLAAGEAAVTDTMHTLRRENNTVYYIIGTKDDLEKRGIVVEEGSKFLFFGHHALVPARKLDPSAFTAIDKFSTTSITIPNPDKGYKIVSRQDPSLVDQPLTSAGKPGGELHISDPTTFWSASKYLIIIAG